jgi:GTP-binding protein
VDVSGIEGRCPKEDFEKINIELEKFSQELAERPQIVAANKSDIATPEQIEEFRLFAGDYPFFVISAATKQGLPELIDCITEQLSKLPPVKSYEPQPLSFAELEQLEKEKTAFTVDKTADGYFTVNAQFLRPILARANMDDYESLQYLQRVLRSSGIIDALEESGIEENDTVNLFGFEFEYVR